MPLFLLPNVFSDDQPTDGLLPSGVAQILESLDCLLAESERSARRYLLKVNPGSQKMRTVPIRLINEHTTDDELHQLARDIRKGGIWGLVSDAGLPCIADPGSRLVFVLRRLDYRDIKAIPGPSSIFLALMASGLPGQRFCFHGYLPKEQEERRSFLRKLEDRSRQQDETQIWIETAYKNRAMAESLAHSLNDATVVSIASHLTFPDESVETLTVAAWKLKFAAWESENPSVYMLYAPKNKKSLP